MSTYDNMLTYLGLVLVGQSAVKRDDLRHSSPCCLCEIFYFCYG